LPEPAPIEPLTLFWGRRRRRLQDQRRLHRTGRGRARPGEADARLRILNACGIAVPADVRARITDRTDNGKYTSGSTHRTFSNKFYHGRSRSRI